jgi:hypothetical protein
MSYPMPTRGVGSFLTDFKRRVIVFVRLPFNAQILYVCRAWTDFDFFDEALQQRPISFRFDLHVAVEKILDPPYQSEFRGVMVHKIPETDSLDISLHDNM